LPLADFLCRAETDGSQFIHLFNKRGTP